MVFTERAIPTLVAAGLQWVIVANNHISRACKVSNDTVHGTFVYTVGWVCLTLYMCSLLRLE